MLSKKRNEVVHGDWIFEKLDDFKIVNDFDCGDDDLNDFIKNDAEAHKKELLAETYIIKATVAATRPVAFISLCNDAIHLSFEKRDMLPNKKRYPSLPAVKIARLGVGLELQGLDVGTYLINLIKRLFLNNNRTGCRFITVDAYNKPRVLKFYQKNDFQFLHDKDQNKQSRIMYFDLKRFNAESISNLPEATS
jgi:GNAT superfamily N-acetyltransferase